MTIGRTQVYNLGNMTPGSGGGGTTTLQLNNTLWVAKNGNDATGTRNLLSKPYLTIAAAIAAASAGDCIFVMPGTYAENITVSGGLYIYLEPGAIVSGNTTISTGTNYIDGYGQFTGTASAITFTGGASDNAYVTCFSITGGTAYAINKTGAGYFEISNCRAITAGASGTGAVYTSAGTTHIFAQVITQDALYAGTDLILFDTGTAAVLLNIDHASRANLGTRCIYSKAGNQRIYFNLVSGYVQSDGTAAVDIRTTGGIGSIKCNPASTSIAPLVLSGTNSSTKIGNMMLAVEGGTGNAAVYSAAAQTVVLNGIVASNKILGANVGYTGSGIFVLDPNMDTGNP
jgi:hypothetical protein